MSPPIVSLFKKTCTRHRRVANIDIKNIGCTQPELLNCWQPVKALVQKDTCRVPPKKTIQSSVVARWQAETFSARFAVSQMSVCTTP
jgi:hypothetical protein